MKKIVGYAHDQKLAIVIENLDFSAKKGNLHRKSKTYRRMLSDLFYAKYTELLRAKCARAGLVTVFISYLFLRHTFPQPRKIIADVAFCAAALGYTLAILYIDSLPPV